MDEALHTERMRQLEGDIQVARSELAATVDELAGWFDPKVRAASAVNRGRRLVHEAADPSADPADRARARVVLGAAAALAAAAVAGVIRRIARR